MRSENIEVSITKKQDFTLLKYQTINTMAKVSLFAEFTILASSENLIFEYETNKNTKTNLKNKTKLCSKKFSYSNSNTDLQDLQPTCISLFL